MSLYVGIDCSTQGLTLQVLSVDATARRDAGAQRADWKIVWQHVVNFDRDLPQYGPRYGALPSADPAIVHAPPQMWADALELGLGALASSGLDLTEIAAISGSAQQHGTVYLDAAGGFSRATSPIWMDTSTSVECAEITAALGGPNAVAQMSGSRAFERFSGPQIRKFWKEDPAAYARTARIHLISSYLASLLIGADAPVDVCDASGMSMMNLRTSDWDPGALDATAPGLRAKLPPIVPSSTVIGRIAPKWRERFGLPAADVVAWLGDNSSSLVGIGLSEEGELGISLGTSDTVFGIMREPRVSPDGIGHVFASPTGGFMGITVFANGSLARERVRDMYGLDWRGFSDALRFTPPGNGGARMLPYFVPEITPHVPVPGVQRFNLDETDVARNVRAVVEAQVNAMKTYSAWMGVTVRKIYATGGASGNPEVLKVMAEIFGVEVVRREVTNTACLGAAIRAMQSQRTT
jgi:xylulokinase